MLLDRSPPNGLIERGFATRAVIGRRRGRGRGGGRVDDARARVWSDESGDCCTSGGHSQELAAISTTPHHTHTHNGASQPTHTERHRERASAIPSLPATKAEAVASRSPWATSLHSAPPRNALGELPRNRALPVRAGGRGLDPVVPLLTAIGCGGGALEASGRPEKRRGVGGWCN